MQTLAQHIRSAEEQSVPLKSAVMEYAAMQRGLSYRRMSRHLIMVEPDGASAIPFHNMQGPTLSYAGRYLADRKQDSRTLLAEADLRVPDSQVFPQDQRGAARRWARLRPGATVVKPTTLARARGVTTGIRTAPEFDAAWERAVGAYRNRSRCEVLVEEHIPGDDIRCFVVGGRLITATQRRRPQVVGDSRSTVGELIAAKNETRAAHPTLYPYLVPDEPEMLDQLAAAGMTVDDVPEQGQIVVLRGVSNLSGGGDSVDVTDTIHAGFRDIAVRAVEAIPGMDYLGVDLIVPDVTASPGSQHHVVTEVEAAPAPLTDFPVEGQPRDMAGAVLNHYLPAGP